MTLGEICETYAIEYSGDGAYWAEVNGYIRNRVRIGMTAALRQHVQPLLQKAYEAGAIEHPFRDDYASEVIDFIINERSNEEERRA